MSIFTDCDERTLGLSTINEVQNDIVSLRGHEDIQVISPGDVHVNARDNIVNVNDTVIEDIDWRKVAYDVLASRLIDEIEERDLAPDKKIYNQFSARGHELSQVILGKYLTHKHDAVLGYYRSRPLLISLGLSLDDAFAGPLAKEGGLTNGRDIGVVFNFKNPHGADVLPMHGGVGGQYTPACGWAQGIVYYRDHLHKNSFKGAISVSHGGDASVVTNGFWAALTNATTLGLPQLFFIEDNGYGISVPSDMQVPGGDITQNLASFGNLKTISASGTDPVETNDAIGRAIKYLRSASQGPVLLRLKVPRLNGHSFQDNQSYKSPELLSMEWEQDPLKRLKEFFTDKISSEEEWGEIEDVVNKDVYTALDKALSRNEPNISDVSKYVFCDEEKRRSVDEALHNDHSGKKVNMVTSIRKTLESELKNNEKLLVFGEDVGAKGGVHTATVGLQQRYGSERVFDTNLSEEGIIGRAVGLAYAGLSVVPEIQFRKYADSAAEQIHDCGMVRWRTNNKFSAPITIRIPVGFSKRGDPWHAECKEVEWAHSIGWQVLFPSNAADAAGLLRAAIRSNNPTIFLEHRSLLDSIWAKRPWQGDDFIVPIGKAKIIKNGSQLTVISWGAMLERCHLLIEEEGFDVDLVDLRSISPWDQKTIIDSVKKTGKVLIVHEDNITAGFGAEIAATIADECFFDLKSPVRRLAPPDIPCPHNINLMNAVIPSSSDIRRMISELIIT
ncbi:MAG TPA: pyruvate dehydrogenase [Gammaproteobacteria bacterium]|nr:pyruvate dehydrogenase [Gammaproteobacteria bacterium]